MLASAGAMSPYNPLSYPLYYDGRFSLPKKEYEAVETVIGKEEAATEEVVEAVPEKEEKTVAVCKVDEETASCGATARDASTQTLQRRRRGGRGSRMRRLLAFQLMLTEKKGLPLPRLLTFKEADARYSKREELMREQEESASPTLKRKSVKVVEAEGKEAKVNLKDMNEKEDRCPSLGASTGDSPIFTPRSFHSDVASPTLNYFPQLPAMSPFYHLSPPPYLWLHTPPFTTFHSSPPSDLMPGHQWLICGTCHSWGSVFMS